MIKESQVRLSKCRCAYIPIVLANNPDIDESPRFVRFHLGFTVSIICGSRKFCQRWSLTRFFFFFFLEGREDPNKCHYFKRATINRQRFACVPIMAQIESFRGSIPVLLRNPIFFVIFQASGSWEGNCARFCGFGGRTKN